MSQYRFCTSCIPMSHPFIEGTYTHFKFFAMQVCFHLLNKEGDIYFQQDLYSNALDKCIQALGYTSKYNNKEHKIIALTKCIEACLKLQKCSDAYIYCTKLLKLDPWNSKVGMHI